MENLLGNTLIKDDPRDYTKECSWVFLVKIFSGFSVFGPKVGD
jgi:hypothetical protein